MPSSTPQPLRVDIGGGDALERICVRFAQSFAAKPRSSGVADTIVQASSDVDALTAAPRKDSHCVKSSAAPKSRETG